MEIIFISKIETQWNTIYAFAEMLHASHKGKNIANKTEKTISEGNPTMAKNILLRTKNNAKRYAHIGIIGFISNLLDISI